MKDMYLIGYKNDVMVYGKSPKGSIYLTRAETFDYKKAKQQKSSYPIRKIFKLVEVK